MSESCENMAVSTAILCLAVCVYHINQQGWHVQQKVLLQHQPTFFCTSLINSKPTWLWPEELKFETNKKIFLLNIHKTTIKKKPVTGNIWLFSTTSGQLVSWLGLPFNKMLGLFEKTGRGFLLNHQVPQMSTWSWNWTRPVWQLVSSRD